MESAPYKLKILNIDVERPGKTGWTFSDAFNQAQTLSGKYHSPVIILDDEDEEVLTVMSANDYPGVMHD